ncbi:MAG: hypothetical protein KGN00_05125 [Chloroflexota bacterium]|nr:hypothetical protein [Chloroflexota bacterium]
MTGTRGTPTRRPVAIRSPWLLRVLAAGTALLSFGSMTYFAAGHVQDPAAPLQPSAPGISTPAPAPAAARASRRSFVSPTVPMTGVAPMTRTRQSGG